MTTRLRSHERERISTEKKANRGEYIRKFQLATQTLAGLLGLSMAERSCIRLLTFGASSGRARSSTTHNWMTTLALIMTFIELADRLARKRPQAWAHTLAKWRDAESVRDGTAARAANYQFTSSLIPLRATSKPASLCRWFHCELLCDCCVQFLSGCVPARPLACQSRGADGFKLVSPSA